MSKGAMKALFLGWLYHAIDTAGMGILSTKGRANTFRTSCITRSIQPGCITRSIQPMTCAFLLAVAVSLGAHALTGSGASATNPLETVSPTLNSVSAVTEKSLSVTFSEAMLAPGVTTPANYAASGAGAGTLGAHPTGMSGTGPYTLTWDSGEMQNGATVTVTAAGVQDLVGNPIDPTHNSASGTGLGIAPQFGALGVAPSQAAVGDTVTITFTASEALNGEPLVSVNDHEAAFVSGGSSYTYTYTVQESDPLGTASVSVTGLDLAANAGSLSNEAALKIIEPEPTLPLRAWPEALALLVLAVAMLVRKRRKTTLTTLRDSFDDYGTDAVYASVEVGSA